MLNARMSWLLRLTGIAVLATGVAAGSAMAWPKKDRKTIFNPKPPLEGCCRDISYEAFEDFDILLQQRAARDKGKSSTHDSPRPRPRIVGPDGIVIDIILF